MLLIYPPVSRSAEPPLGIARLAGFLRAGGFEATCLDLCQEGLEYLLGLPSPFMPSTADGAEPKSMPSSRSESAWARGALKRRTRNLELLRGGGAFDSADRYRRVVLDLNRALKTLSAGSGAEASLADYRDPRLSPLRRADLLEAAAAFEGNAFYPLFARRIDEELASANSRAVGVSICFLSQALCAFAIIGYIKKAHPYIPIIVGGGLVSSWIAQGSLSREERFGGLVDAILPGRGEEGIVDCLRSLGGLEPDRSTDACARRVSAAPDFSDFAHREYFSPTRIAPYNFSWGCPWRRCSFCPEKAEGSKYVGLRADEAMGEIASLVSSHTPGLLHFTDNEIAPLYLRLLAESPPGPRWYGFARFSSALADPAFCRGLAASGCAMLQLGLESGDQKVLDALDKGTSLVDIDRTLDNLATAGIATYVYLLFGTPAEGRDSALRTRDFVAARADRIGFLNVAIFNLPATSEEAGKLDTKSFYEGEFSLYSEFRHPAGWDRSAVRDFLAREFSPEPAIAAILARNPPVFTSSHAALFPKLQSAPSR